MDNSNQIAQSINAANIAAAKQYSTYLPPISTFKKGSMRSSSIHEEPTLLSFFFLIHFDDAGASPLFGSATNTNGIPQRTALNYFEKTVSNTDPAYGAKKAAQLKSFINIFRKVNTEMPWFWQTVTGLEVARTITEEEPWKAAEKPKIEIECLEENIELTATKLMDLYRNIVWDTKRHVRILPTNVSRFTMDIYVTEVRAFQANTGSPLLGSYRGATAYEIYSNSTQDSRNVDAKYAAGFTKENFESIAVGETKPVFAIRLVGCEFDMNSGQETFAELSKNPEAKKAKIGIFYKYAETLVANGGPNLPLDALLKQNEQVPGGASLNDTRNPYDPMDDMPKVNQAEGGADAAPTGTGVPDRPSGATGNVYESSVESGGIANASEQDRSANAKGNVYESNRAGDAIANNRILNSVNVHGFNRGPLADAVMNFGAQAVDSFIANSGNEKLQNLRKLLLGNVYGMGPGMDLRNAIGLASANALGAAPILISQLLNKKNEKTKVASDLDNVYNGPAVDSSPDGNLNDNVYE